jgi:hypothetical protein
MGLGLDIILNVLMSLDFVKMYCHLGDLVFNV